jgi:hypothetical protein
VEIPKSLPDFNASLLPESASGLNLQELDSKMALDIHNTLSDFKPLVFYTSEKWSIYPIGYHFYNQFEGGELMGVNAAFKLNNLLTGNIGTSLTKSFYGYLYPHPVDNGSLSMDVTLHLHERIQLFGFGKVSMREGIDPGLAPVINAGTYYGGGVKIKILKNFGIGVGVSNNYFRKNWNLQPFAVPVFYP